MDYVYTLCILTGIAVSLAVSLNIASGYSRTLCLSHAAFWGLGAYGFALATRAGYSPVVGLMAAMAAAGLGGVVVGTPTLRVRDDYFLIATLGMGEVLNTALVNLRSITGGSGGLSGIVLLPWVRPGGASNAFYCLTAVLFAAVVVYVGMRVQYSPFGQALLAVAEDEDATASLGRSVAGLKVRALVLGASLAGLGGALYASWASFISPGLFTTGASLLVLAMVLMGGLGNVCGAVVGAVLMTAIPEALRFAGVSGPNAQLWQQVIYGLLLIVMMALRPQGVLPAPRGGKEGAQLCPR